MIWLRFLWHRYAEWQHQRRAEWLFASGRRNHDAALHHGAQADRIRRDAVQGPPREWKPRLWDRDGDKRTEQEERRP